MEKFNLTGNSLSKAYTRNREIFSNINVNLNNSDIIAITGPNGSGKSTLLKIMCGIIKPSKGTIELIINGTQHKKENLFEQIGFVSPYLNLYEEFTPLEHLRIASKLAGTKFNEAICIESLKLFKLYAKRNEPIRTFSSGMKQRMKYILALQKSPKILFLDEPMTNLDTEGIDVVTQIIQNHRNQDGATIIATNDEREKALCHRFIDLQKS